MLKKCDIGELSLSKMYLDAALDTSLSTFDDAEKTCILAAEMAGVVILSYFIEK